MAKPLPLAAPSALSLTTLAQAFGCSRDHMRRKLDDARVAPAGERGGHPVYRLRDAIEAWGLTRTDPTTMDPVQRRAHYQAELEQIELETKKRELIPRIEVEQEGARLAKIITQLLETLPDVLERDCGLAPGVVARIEQCIDSIRGEIAERIADPQPESDQPAAEEEATA